MDTSGALALIKIGPVMVASPQVSSLTDGPAWVGIFGELEKLTTRAEPANILLDLHRAEDVSVGVISDVNELVNRAVATGGSLRICALRQPFRGLLERVCLQHLYLGDGVPEALPRYVRHLRMDRNVSVAPEKGP